MRVVQPLRLLVRRHGPSRLRSEWEPSFLGRKQGLDFEKNSPRCLGRPQLLGGRSICENARLEEIAVAAKEIAVFSDFERMPGKRKVLDPESGVLICCSKFRAQTTAPGIVEEHGFSQFALRRLEKSNLQALFSSSAKTSSAS